jgi:methylthioribose-1-phosphate isomerase
MVEQSILIDDYQVMIDAIKKLKIRGAPALGIAAAAAAYLACKKFQFGPEFEKNMFKAVLEIKNSRPTAVNLFNATQQITQILTQNTILWVKLIDDLVNNLMEYEYKACEKMAQSGYDFIPKHMTKFLTHCNTGSLATYGIGTGLGVLKKINAQRKIEVFVTETRPLLQGTRLTLWELKKANIKATLIADSMIARTIQTKGIQGIITGADRIAKNGDFANKIGTLNLAIIAKHFNIPFYVVAPETTIDEEAITGKQMVMEERDAEELTTFNGVQVAPDGTQVFNPAFDVTPFEMVAAIITDERVWKMKSVYL